jgi:hypothetical protein
MMPLLHSTKPRCFFRYTENSPDTNSLPTPLYLSFVRTCFASYACACQISIRIFTI